MASLASAVGDLTTLNDIDNYIFTVSPGTTSVTVRLSTVGLSLLNAKVTVFDASGSQVATASSGGSLAMQDITLTIAASTANQSYIVRIERGTNDAFGIGAYALAVGYNFRAGWVHR